MFFPLRTASLLRHRPAVVQAGEQRHVTISRSFDKESPRARITRTKAGTSSSPPPLSRGALDIACVRHVGFESASDAKIPSHVASPSRYRIVGGKIRARWRENRNYHVRNEKRVRPHPYVNAKKQQGKTQLVAKK